MGCGKVFRVRQMTLFILYVIRHKESNTLMPLMKRGRGYSHWNPSNPNAHKITVELNIPRFLSSRKQAKRVIDMWFSWPNGKTSGYQSRDGEWDDTVDTKTDNRKKEDLEVVEVRIEE